MTQEGNRGGKELLEGRIYRRYILSTLLIKLPPLRITPSSCGSVGTYRRHGGKSFFRSGPRKRNFFKFKCGIWELPSSLSHKLAFTEAIGEERLSMAALFLLLVTLS